jgi:hypothetical protein
MAEFVRRNDSDSVNLVLKPNGSSWPSLLLQTVSNHHRSDSADLFSSSLRDLLILSLFLRVAIQNAVRDTKRAIEGLKMNLFNTACGPL